MGIPFLGQGTLEEFMAVNHDLSCTLMLLVLLLFVESAFGLRSSRCALAVVF